MKAYLVQYQVATVVIMKPFNLVRSTGSEHRARTLGAICRGLFTANGVPTWFFILLL
jgi:hypothetical protein